MSEATAAPAQQPGAAAPAPPAPTNVTQPAPTPAPTPSNEPAPLNVDPPAAPPTPALDENVEVLYNPTGDTGLDLALAFVGKLGYGPDRPEIQAAQKGDFAPLEAALKANPKAAGYDKFVTVAKESYKRTADKAKTTADAAQKAVIEAVGGVEKWNAVHAWVVAEADDAQKSDINAAFKQGGLAATAMARQLADLYAQSGASTQKPKGVVKATASAAEPATSGVLDASAYKVEVRKLEAKYGYRLTETAEYQELSARRLAAIRSGN